MSWFRPTPAPSRVSILSNSLIRRAYHPPPHTQPCVRTPPLKRTPNARRARRTPVPNDVHKLVRHSKCLGTNCLLWHNCKTWCHGLCHGVTVCVKPDFECQTEFGRSRHRSVARKLFGSVCVCVVCCVLLCVLCVVVCVVGSRGFPPNASNIITRAEHPCARTSRNGTRLTCRCAPVDITATTARAHLRRHLDRPDAILRTFPPRHRRCTRS